MQFLLVRLSGFGSFFYHLPVWKQAWFVSGDYRRLLFHIVSVWERWDPWGVGGDPEFPLIFHITGTSFSFLEVVCCKDLKVFCGLRSLGMSGICCEALAIHLLTCVVGCVAEPTQWPRCFQTYASVFLKQGLFMFVLRFACFRVTSSRFVSCNPSVF